MQRIDIKLKPSKLFIALIGVTVLCCLVIILTLPIAKLSKGFLCMLILPYGWVVLRDYGLLQCRHSIVGLSLIAGVWQLQDRLQVSTAELGGESTLTTWVHVLCFKTQTGRRSCVIFKDALSREDYRRLSVLVRTASAIKASQNRAQHQEVVL